MCDHLEKEIRKMRSSFASDCLIGETVVKHWYQEQKYYDYYQNQDLLHTQASRFTQLVWKSSQKIGIGKATIGGL